MSQKIDSALFDLVHSAHQKTTEGNVIKNIPDINSYKYYTKVQTIKINNTAELSDS